MAKWEVVAAPFSCAEVGGGDPGVAEGGEEKEEGGVGGGCVDGFGGVRDCDTAGGTGGDVDLVVARAIVADEFDGGG